MYIFELIQKIKNEGFFKKEKENKKPLEEEYPKCEHVFLPVDSTKKVLACIKCGVLMKNKIKK